jgi:hypothetical protein
MRTEPRTRIELIGNGDFLYMLKKVADELPAIVAVLFSE